MSTSRAVRVTVDGVEAAIRTERGGSYAVGNERLPFEVHVLTLSGGAPWCAVTVHRRPGADVSVAFAPRRGPRPKPADARRTVELRFWLTPAEATRVGLGGDGRNEAARARLLTPEVELAELFSARTSPVPEDVRRLCVVAGELASRAAPRVIRELCRRLTEAEARLAGDDRHERARERVTDSARAEALTATLERAQQALRAILDATGCSYSPPPDEWPRAAVEEVRRVVAGFGGAS